MLKLVAALIAVHIILEAVATDLVHVLPVAALILTVLHKDF